MRLPLIDTAQRRTTTEILDANAEVAVLLKPRYDVIVCGSGSSGSVVAGRLSANPHLQVLLLEAGSTDDTPLVSDPNAWVRNLGSERDWQFQAAPNAALNGRAVPFSMGKVLGGGSSINVATWSRGHLADWDHMAELTKDPAWSYDSVLAIYQKLENWQGTPDPTYRGTGGPMYVQPAQAPHPFSTALLDAAEANGIQRFENANGRMMEAAGGCSVIDEILRGDKRQSVYQSYVAPLVHRPNLTVVTGALVERIAFEGKRATGVEVLLAGKRVLIHALHQVVLSLGAIQTPKVLMQSGIGSPGHLAGFDIPVVSALPHVGEHLHDHIAIGCTWEATDADLPCVPRSQVVAFWKSRPELREPNMLMYSRAGSALSGANTAHFVEPAKSWSLFLGMRPASRGRVQITGAHANDPVHIDSGYLNEPADLQDFAAGIAMCRAIGNAEAFRPFTRSEVAPNSADPKAIENFIRNGVVTFWHQSGTARMGVGEEAVVDSRLRVLGLEGLRVADASVLPRVTTGNTMAPCVLIGEQAAHFIQQDLNAGGSSPA